MDKINRTLTLRAWFRLMAVGLVLVVLLVEGRLLQLEWQQRLRAERGQQAVARLRLALSAAEMVSRERGPTNGVLGDELAGAAPARQEALRAARANTDRAVSAFRTVAMQETEDARYRMAVQRAEQLVRWLQRARQSVDQLAALPRDQRRPEEIRLAVSGMVDLVPMLSPAITLLADEAQLADPSLGPAVWGARLAAELREYAGQLGSLFTPALTRHQRFAQQDLAAIERVQGRIEQLRSLLDVRVGMLEDSDAIKVAHAEMLRAYFDQGRALLQPVLDAGIKDGQFGLTAAAFADQYVPRMNAIIGLRDAMLDGADLRCQQEQRRVHRTLLVVSIMTLLLMGLVLAMLRLAHQRFVLPLSQAAGVLHAMSAGDYGHELPHVTADGEIAEVIGGIAALKQQSEARLALERERDKLIDTLREQSSTDFLTALPNRRAFFEAAGLELARARRHGFKLVLMLLDVDHFKKVNDSVGHVGGDEALKAVAAMLRQTTRQGDLSARLGGEEFVVLLTHCEADDGMRFAERLREAIAVMAVPVGAGQPPLTLTVSIGLADSSTHGLKLDDLIARADDAMYQAKNAGRNRTVMAT